MYLLFLPVELFAPHHKTGGGTRDGTAAVFSYKVRTPHSLSGELHI